MTLTTTTSINNNNKLIVDEDEEEELLPPPPVPPDPDLCCGTGCARCVYDIYDEQLEKYELLKDQIEKRNKKRRDLKLQKQQQQQLETINNSIENNNSNLILDQQQIEINKNISNNNNNNEIKEYKEEEEEEEEDISSDNSLIKIRDDEKNSSRRMKNYLSSKLYRKYKIQFGYINEYRNLTSEQSPSLVYHLDIESMGSELAYKPGDYATILCPMDKQLVDRVLRRLNLDGDRCILIEPTREGKDIPGHLPKEGCSIRDIFTWNLNLAFIPEQYFLKILSAYCSDGSEKKKLEFLSSPTGTSLYNETVIANHIDFLTILKKFKSCYPPLDILLIYLPPHQIRKYSISSSPLSTNSNNFHITFNLHKKVISTSINPTSKTKNKEYYGLCTYWMHKQIENYKKKKQQQQQQIKQTSSPSPALPLQQQQPGIIELNNDEEENYIPFAIEPTPSFTLPKELSVPIILISAGTGLAPFRSFLQHRKVLINRYYQKKASAVTPIGQCWLFFGCKRKDWDQLYYDELSLLEREKIIYKMVVSYSQDHDHTKRKYINHHLEDHGPNIHNLIVKQNGIIYVCGDSNKIGVSANNSIKNIIKKQENVDDSKAEDILNDWKRKGQYLKDVY
eukprot:gene1451-1829_t